MGKIISTWLYCFLFFLSLYPIATCAQYDVTGLDLSDDVTHWFDQQIDPENTPLVLGTYKEVARTSRSSHPFFLKSVWTEGTLNYRRQLFHEVNMLYNTSENVLIIQHPSNIMLSNEPILLNQTQVNWFIIDGLTFRNYTDDRIPNGFYQELYIGDAFDLIIKRMKRNESSTTNLDYVFKENDHYHFRVEENYYRFNNKWSILKAMKAWKKSIRHYIKSNHLQIKKGNDSDLRELAAYCDELLQEK